MTTFERWERGTQGVINLALVVAGGAKKLFGHGVGGEPVPGERVPVPGEGGPVGRRAPVQLRLARQVGGGEVVDAARAAGAA